ncbi:MAG: hypothetical protein IPG81_19155 [Sandaracinaceae bacterium]|nr:hypothetical protein [Sandaracinaceae bacterium]
MTCSPGLAHRPRLAALALLSVLVGCGGTGDAPVDLGPGPSDLPRDNVGPAVRYRITELHIPTLAEANADVPVGHNVDRVGDTCGVPDFDGGVDNSLIDLSAALADFAPPAEGLILQAAIDAALHCAEDAEPTECTRLDLFVSVASGTGITVIAIEDGAGTTLAGPFVGSLDGSGNLRAVTSQLDLTIPYHAASGPVDVRLDIVSMILTANLSDSAMTNIVLGGALPSSAFEAMLMEVLPLLADEPTFEDVEPILANLYDVQLSGQCSALSVGFTGTATRVPTP